QPEVNLQCVHRDPGEQVQFAHPLLGRQREHGPEQQQAVSERGDHRRAAEQMAPAVGAPARRQQHQRAQRRESDQQPRVLLHRPGGGDRLRRPGFCREKCPGTCHRRHHAPSQYFSRLASSTEAERRVRKIDMMMASPTTTSAAATTITKKAMTCPSTVPAIRAKVTSVRLTALSISSTHMKTTIALRRTSTPTTPMLNSNADSSK